MITTRYGAKIRHPLENGKKNPPASKPFFPNHVHFDSNQQFSILKRLWNVFKRENGHFFNLKKWKTKKSVLVAFWFCFWNVWLPQFKWFDKKNVKMIRPKNVKNDSTKKMSKWFDQKNVETKFFWTACQKT